MIARLWALGSTARPLPLLELPPHIRSAPGAPMLSLLARKPWYLLVLPAAVLLGVLGYRGSTGISAGNPELAALASANGGSAPVTQAFGSGADSPLQSNAVAAGLPLNLRAAFENGTDLFAYARQLQAAADAGNAEAGWVISRIHEYCGVYAMDPQSYVLDSAELQRMGLDAVPAMSAARDKVKQGCVGFSAADGLGRDALLRERVRSARDGNLAAEAALLSMGAPLGQDAAYRRGLAERVLNSQDPEAFLAISAAMGVAASGDDAYAGMVAGSQFSQLAWQVAACQLGLPCGPGSALMVAYCANGGICSRDPGQDFQSFVYDAAVPRQSVEKMDQWINSLRTSRRGKQ